MNRFINPELIWEISDRYKKGCFSCSSSKRGMLRGEIQSYCQAEEDGLIKPDYPNEDAATCDYYGKKKVKHD